MSNIGANVAGGAENQMQKNVGGNLVGIADGLAGYLYTTDGVGNYSWMKNTFVRPLYTGPNISAVATSDLTLYTANTYSRLLGVFVKVISLSGTVTVPGVISIGKTGAGYQDIIADTTLTTLTAVGNTQFIPFTTGGPIENNDVVKARLDTAFTVTGGSGTMTISIMPVGFDFD